MRFLRGHLPKDARCLDFGAGDGDLTALLVAEGHRVAALEPSAERRRTLERRLGASPNFLGVIDPETTEPFDIVLMVEVIEHILEDELDGALHLLSCLVRPGGTLIVTTPYDEDLELAMAVSPETGLLFHRWQHVRSFTPESLGELLSRYGFDPIIHHGFDHTVRLDARSAREPKRWLSWVFGPKERAARKARRDLARGRSVRIGSAATLVMIARRRGELALP